MKKIAKLVMVILCSMMLFACGKNSEEDNTHIIDGVTYIHYPEDNMITAGVHKYIYSYEEVADGCLIVITYPDDIEISVMINGSLVSSEGHWAQGTKYADPVNLAMMINSYKEANTDPVQVPLIIAGIVMALLGVVMIGAPEIGFKLKYWEIKDAEQTETSKGVSIALGIIMCIIGVIMVLIGIF